MIAGASDRTDVTESDRVLGRGGTVEASCCSFFTGRGARLPVAFKVSRIGSIEEMPLIVVADCALRTVGGGSLVDIDDLNRKLLIQYF
jgi:hypothetical protein